MDLLDLLRQSGGDESVSKLADSVGIDDSSASRLISTLSPAIARGLERQGPGTGDGFEGLKKALEKGDHARYIDRPELMASGATREDGNRILGHLFGSKDVSRQVAARASEKTGLDAATIKQALPLIAGLAMGALSKKTTADSGGVSGDRLGGLLGGLLGSGDDGFGIDDVMSLARKFF